jgi:hypothetical protein
LLDSLACPRKTRAHAFLVMLPRKFPVGRFNHGITVCLSAWDDLLWLRCGSHYKIALLVSIRLENERRPIKET